MDARIIALTFEAPTLYSENLVHQNFKQVITLDNALLEEEMQRLWRLVTLSGHEPDALVGIATGGVFCARAVASVMPIRLFSCAMRRPGTEFKQRSPLTRLLAYTPYALTDRLRRYEDRKLERRALANGQQTIPAASKQLQTDIALIDDAVRSLGLGNLLVVDDAVDSGATLGCVVQNLRAALPSGTRVISAVLTKTRPNSLFEPDFHLYDQVLCRFPWSFDFRGI